MTHTVHLDSLSVVLRFTLIQLALMDPTELMGVMQQGHTGTHTHSGSCRKTQTCILPNQTLNSTERKLKNKVKKNKDTPCLITYTH